MKINKTEAIDDGWRISDALWERIKFLLPPPPPHPLGCHRPAVEPRKAMDAIFFVLMAGAQWKSLSACGFIPDSTAHDWLQRWLGAGAFHELRKMVLVEYDEVKVEERGGRTEGAGTRPFFGNLRFTHLGKPP